MLYSQSNLFTQGNLPTNPDFQAITMLNPFKYHSIESRRLWDVTVAGLELNGISTEDLGEKHLGRFVLRGGLRLSHYAISLILYTFHNIWAD